MRVCIVGMCIRGLNGSGFQCGIRTVAIASEISAKEGYFTLVVHGFSFELTSYLLLFFF